MLIIKLRSANTAETRQYKKASKALLVLIPLLGITYLVVWIGPENGVSSQMFDVLRAFLISTQVSGGCLSHEPFDSIRFNSIRFVLIKSFSMQSNSFFKLNWNMRLTLTHIHIRMHLWQGFSVSLLYCFLNSEVKQALYHRISIWREKRNIGNDTQTDYRKHRNGLSKEYSSPRSRTESIR